MKSINHGSQIKSSEALILIILIALLAVLPVVWPGLDLKIASYLFGPEAKIDASQWSWVIWSNLYVPMVGRWIVLASLILAAFVILIKNKIGKELASFVIRHAMFIAFGLLMGPGWLVLLVKDWWLRARPREVSMFGGEFDFTPALAFTDQCQTNCSFVSGHAATGFFIATLYLLGGKWRWWFLIGGVVVGSFVGFARMAVGAHWFSDVIWALLFTMLASYVTWLLLFKVKLPFR